MGYVYLLLEVDSDGNERHKIGVSKNDPSKRQKQLQTGNPNVISVLNKYESVNYRKIEKWLHSNLKNQKTEAENEWFKLTDEQVLNFKTNCENLEKTIALLLESNPFYK